jgi:hypothetical protein
LGRSIELLPSQYWPFGQVIPPPASCEQQAVEQLQPAIPLELLVAPEPEEVPLELPEPEVEPLLVEVFPEEVEADDFPLLDPLDAVPDAFCGKHWPWLQTAPALQSALVLQVVEVVLVELQAPRTRPSATVRGARRKGRTIGGAV